MNIEKVNITDDLDMALRDLVASYDRQQVFLLADSNTIKHCITTVQATLSIAEEHIIVIEAGEEQKTLQTVEQIWQRLFAAGATRHSLLISVGGGMVCDIGGFAASTFMRGISYANIPTTLLAMVDAANGGKTGINYGGLKNSIGLFAQPLTTIISLSFLKTLPIQEFLSGYAEMLKHSLISSPLELSRLLRFDIETMDYEELAALVKRSQVIKSYIVEQDPTEQGLRKSLNFGHTIGHAIEEMSLQRGQPMPHGYAVFYGLIAELYLSVKKLGLQKQVLEQCLPLYYEYYGKIQCDCRETDKLLTLMRHDKKNTSVEHINFTLLKAVGNPWIDQSCTDDDIREALDYLFTL